MQFLDILCKQACYFFSVTGTVVGDKVPYLSKPIYYNYNSVVAIALRQVRNKIYRQVLLCLVRYRQRTKHSLLYFLGGRSASAGIVVTGLLFNIV
jgi:hypothetical protein